MILKKNGLIFKIQCHILKKNGRILKIQGRILGKMAAFLKIQGRILLSEKIGVSRIFRNPNPATQLLAFCNFFHQNFKQ